METFLAELKRELKRRKLFKNEIDEIIAFYREIISDRQENGEDLANIIASYDIKEIGRRVFPQTIQKRDTAEKGTLNKTLKGIIIFLFSAPVLIPLGIVYLSFLIVIFAIALSGVAVTISGIIALGALFVRLFTLHISVSTSIATIGLAITVIATASFIVYFLIQGLIFIVRGSIKIVSKFVGGGKRYESIS